MSCGWDSPLNGMDRIEWSRVWLVEYSVNEGGQKRLQVDRVVSGWLVYWTDREICGWMKNIAKAIKLHYEE